MSEQKKPGLVGVRVIKERSAPVAKSLSPTQVDYENTLAAGDWIEPPVDLFGLRVMVSQSTILPQCARALTQILMGLLNCCFALEVVEEVQPSEDMLELPGMADELRRPMMLLVRAKKQAIE